MRTFYFFRYKKNLKTLYVVHPTNFIKIVCNIFKPLIRLRKKKKNPTSSKLCCFTDPVSHVTSTVSFSHKFGKKLKNVNFLDELREHVNFEQLIIPSDVLR